MYNSKLIRFEMNSKTFGFSRSKAHGANKEIFNEKSLDRTQTLSKY